MPQAGQCRFNRKANIDREHPAATVGIVADLVATREHPDRFFQPLVAHFVGAGGQLCPEGFELGAQSVMLAGVVAHHVHNQTAAPELFAMLQFMDDRGAIAGVVGAYDDEGTQAESDQSARHPIEGQNRNWQPSAKAFKGQFHIAYGFVLRMYQQSLGRLQEGDAIHIVKVRPIRKRGVKPRGGVKLTNTYDLSVGREMTLERSWSVGIALSLAERR